MKFELSPSLNPGQAHDSLGLPHLQLGPTPTLLGFAKPHISGPATPLLQLVMARDCRTTALVRAHLQNIQVGQVEVRIPARWASLSLDLSATLGTNTEQWPAVLEIALSAAFHPSKVSTSLRAGDPLPALVVGGSGLAPFSAWVGVPLPVVEPQSRALGFLASSLNRDYLGWMIGCVSTGLSDLYQASKEARFLESLKQLLSGYGEGLPLESPRRGHPLGSSPAERLNSHLESFAPVAALARLERWEARAGRSAILHGLAQRMIQVSETPQDFLTTEGCFTLAFPLAAVARTLNQPTWADKAAELCLKSWSFLVREEGIVQRAYLDGPTHMVNWARGTAWLLLGTVQTALELPSDHPALPELAQRFRQVVPQVLEQQNRNGLWNVFTHQPSSGPETSGSAGIAAALARALQLDWLNPSVLSACRRCAQGLQAYIEMDGCLAGVSQHNPASEEALQLDYRIRAAWGTGLYGQLVAALSLL